MTIVEVAMTTGIMTVVLAVLLQALSAYSTSAAVTQSKVYTVDNVRHAMEIVLKDLRAANPISPLSPVSLYDNEISFTVYCSTPGVGSCAVNGSRPTTYRVTNHALTRTVSGTTRVLIGPSDGVGGARSQRAGAVVNAASEPVFQFFDVTGARLETSGASASAPTRFRDCSRTVRLTLEVVGATGKTSLITFRSTVDLRNFQEVSAC